MIVTSVRYPNHQPNPFETYTSVNSATGCIEWTGDKYPAGYGRARLRIGEPREIRAHRRGWEIAYGPIPDGMDVLHRCDNPKCVNPKHLFLGNDKDNCKDKLTKKRNINLAGAEHGRSKLTPEDVMRIREASLFGASRASLSRSYGVSDVAIQKIVIRENWAHLR